jgi:hypothetical protein
VEIEGSMSGIGGKVYHHAQNVTPALGTCLSPALLSQLAQYTIGNSALNIVTHGVIPVSACFAVPFHDCSSLLRFHSM